MDLDFPPSEPHLPTGLPHRNPALTLYASYIVVIAMTVRFLSTYPSELNLFHSSHGRGILFYPSQVRSRLFMTSFSRLQETRRSYALEKLYISCRGTFNHYSWWHAFFMESLA